MMCMICGKRCWLLNVFPLCPLSETFPISLIFILFVFIFKYEQLIVAAVTVCVPQPQYQGSSRSLSKYHVLL